MAIVALVTVLISMFLEPLVALHVYNWYVLPVTEYALTYWLFFGLFILVGLLRGVPVADYTQYETFLKENADLRAQRAIIQLFVILFAWGSAFLIHLIIT